MIRVSFLCTVKLQSVKSSGGNESMSRPKSQLPYVVMANRGNIRLLCTKKNKGRERMKNNGVRECVRACMRTCACACERERKARKRLQREMAV